MKRIEEILELIEITGDKCIILHKQSEAYVLMKFEEYRDFYKNRLNQTERSDNSTPVVQDKNYVSRQPKDQPQRPIPQKSADIREFELRKPVFPKDDEDIYFTEPLME
jgi:hypothetical protein